MTSTSLPPAHHATLAERIARCDALARRPGAEDYLDPSAVDIEAWNYVGDPLCEDLLALLRERKMMRGDLLAATRRLADEGAPAALDFLADVETVPSWLDVPSLHQGASMARRNPLGFIIAIHGALPLTYLDPATADVMGATGRLARGGDFRRRFWETASGFVGAVDVEGMMPGGVRWEKWVRIRLLHTMIRTGIRRSGRWSRGDSGTPISQLATAATTRIFGQYRVNIIEYVGAPVTQAERDGFALMWRWVSRIEGAINQLLGRTHMDEQRLQTRIHEFLVGPSGDAQRLAAAVVDGTASMATFGRSRRLNHAISREVLSPRVVGPSPVSDVRHMLGLGPDLRAERLVRVGAAASRLAHRVTRLKVVRALADRHGQRLLDQAVLRGLGHVEPAFRGTPVAGRPTDV